MAFSVFMTRRDNSNQFPCYFIRDRVTGECWQVSFQIRGWIVWRGITLATITDTPGQAFDYIEERLGNLGLASRIAV